MVRLMLVLAPVMCILSGIAVSSLLSSFMKNLDVFSPKNKKKKVDSSYPLKNEVAGFVIVMITFFLMTYTFHCTWVGGQGLVCYCLVIWLVARLPLKPTPPPPLYLPLIKMMALVSYLMTSVRLITG